MSSAFSSCVPCDMLMRTPSAPAASIASKIFGSREAGPIVAIIFALLKTVLSVPESAVSNQVRYYGWNRACVLIKFSAKHFTQEFLFTAHANDRADGENNDRDHQPKPMTNGQSGRQKHAEHARVDWISHHTIRPLCD